MGAGWEIRGTVGVAPELASRVGPQGTLFLIARDEQGALFAVTRLLGPNFPLRYRIGPENVMMPGTPLPARLRLSARLSRSGTAGPAEPGDLEGERAGAVSPGAGEADIVLTRLR
jgi:cytochrome c-type biogenesis protein CcmH